MRESKKDSLVMYMIYEYIKDIDVTDRFVYIAIIIVSMVFATRLPMSAHGIIGAVIGIFIVFYFNEKRDNAGDTFISSMKKILQSDIMKPTQNKYLSTDSELLIFLDSYREYYQYNPSLWNSMVKQINNFLKLSRDIEIGVNNYNMDYDVLREIKVKILNLYHSFIHKIPHTESSSSKYHKGIDRLQDLLNMTIDKIHRLVVGYNNKTIDTATTFHYRNHPPGRDVRNNPHYHFF
jgi:hypothetical protein